MGVFSTIQSAGLQHLTRKLIPAAPRRLGGKLRQIISKDLGQMTANLGGFPERHPLERLSLPQRPSLSLVSALARINSI
jgi:hypothetical protein